MPPLPHPLIWVLFTFAAPAAAAAAAAPPPSPPSCRCLPSSPCWAAIPWASLNASVSGRLLPTNDPLSVCRGPLNATPSCAAVLAATDDEFFLTSQPDGFTRTGMFGVWNSSTVQSAFTIAAETEGDVTSAVAFAAAHNLRLTAKGTGHGWFHGGTAPGSLMLVTHKLATIQFLPAFAPRGCPAPPSPVPAVTVGAGVQFRALYDAAEAAGRMVMGGTCDSVGVGGCWMGGCYGTFSKLYGTGASNLLSARVVLANGTLVVASECENADLFWALRGGGGGTFGVVTEFTARTHAPPKKVLLGGATITAVGEAAFLRAVKALLNYSMGVMAPPWGGGVGWGRASTPGQFQVTAYPKGFEVDPGSVGDLFAPLLDLAHSDPAAFPKPAVSWSIWTSGSGEPLPWVEVHPDRELSTSLVRATSKWPTTHSLAPPNGPDAIARAMVDVALLAPSGMKGTIGIDFEKGQLGASPLALSLLANTSINPFVADALGLLLVAYRFPFLPTAPRAVPVLRALWPRLQQYVVLGPSDPMFSGCAAGAAGDVDAAAACLGGLAGERAAALGVDMEAVVERVEGAFPSTESGSYLNEGDYLDADWQRSGWGEGTYARLLEVKGAVDPAGPFVCHHCVGSEGWSEDGNCRRPEGRAKS